MPAKMTDTMTGMKSTKAQLLVTLAAVLVAVMSFAVRGLPPQQSIWNGVWFHNQEQVVRAVNWGIGVDARLPGDTVRQSIGPNLGVGPEHTPLDIAAMKEQKDTMELLLAKGAEVNAKNVLGRTVLHHVAISGTGPEYAELLIANGADVNATDDVGSTPLHMSVEGGCSECRDRRHRVTEVLVANGANVNARDNSGRTPLHAAEREEAAELLIAKGADANARDSDGRTPLHMVWRKEVAEVLITKGAQVDARGNDGQTPLFHAGEHGREEVVRLLIAKGAEVNAKDNEGRTPLKTALLALQRLHKEAVWPDSVNAEVRAHLEAVAKLLRQHGATE